MRLLHSLPLLLLLASPAVADPAISKVRVDPPSLRLSGPGASHTLLVHGETGDGRTLDLTHGARYHSTNPKVASVSPAGVVEAVADGDITISVAASGQTLTVKVEVRDSAKQRRLNFENDITPLLSRHGCNSSGCHGK